MRCLKITLALLAAAFFSFVLNAQEIRSIDIKVSLFPDGSAELTQLWDVNVISGTEFYVPVGNLEHMDINNLRVSENGVDFISDGENWDPGRSALQKAGRCGIVRTKDGLELCWGQGTYGAHLWTVKYHIDGLVQGYPDFDGFNYKFVNPGMFAAPQYVRIEIRNAQGAGKWTSDKVRVWGFGSRGSINLTDSGSIVYESSSPFSSKSSVICLVRFEKGLFSPAVVHRDRTFENLADKALKGSEYLDAEKEDVNCFRLFVLLLIVFIPVVYVIFVLICKLSGHEYKKSMFGKSKIDGWYRAVPLEGKLPAAYYVLRNGMRFGLGEKTEAGIIGTYFLKWIMEKVVAVLPDNRHPDRLNIEFKDLEHVFEDKCENKIYQIAIEAAGSNHILETNELEKWAKKHENSMTSIPEAVANDGYAWMFAQHYMKGIDSTNEEGRKEAVHVIEFRNFLKEFTLSNERVASEVGLWKTYLIYAQMFGIADKVASQFKKLYPQQFSEFAGDLGMSDVILYNTIRMNNSIARMSYMRALEKAASKSARGLGGGTSFGGGGGFSGGGSGGGSR